jgi:hypothetical protein
MAAMTTWQYRIESIPLQEQWFGRQPQEFQRFLGVFNQIGSEGWELVSYQAMPVFGSITGNRRARSSSRSSSGPLDLTRRSGDGGREDHLLPVASLSM